MHPLRQPVECLNIYTAAPGGKYRGHYAHILLFQMARAVKSVMMGKCSDSGRRCPAQVNIVSFFRMSDAPCPTLHV